MKTDNRSIILDSLSEFEAREYDWDGAGGLPIRTDVRDMLELVYDSKVIHREIQEDCPNPGVTMSADGTVEVAYADRCNDRQLFLTFQCAAVVTFLKVFKDEETTVEGTIRIDMSDPCRVCERYAVLNTLYEWLLEEC